MTADDLRRLLPAVMQRAGGRGSLIAGHLAAMRAHPLGHDATVIGHVIADDRGLVMMKTRVGGTRVVDMLSGEQLPRIC